MPKCGWCGGTHNGTEGEVVHKIHPELIGLLSDEVVLTAGTKDMDGNISTIALTERDLAKRMMEVFRSKARYDGFITNIRRFKERWEKEHAK